MSTTSTEAATVTATGVTARASVSAQLIGRRTVLADLRSEPPLTLRPTPDALYLVGSGAGPLGGDALALDIEVGDGAELTLRSVAASMVLPGPHARTSSTVVTASVGAGATLRYLPEQMIAVDGCDHVATTTITVGAGSRLVWREEVVLGRHDEAPGSLLQRLRADRLAVDGTRRPLLRNDLALGPRWPGWDSPAVLGDHLVAGTLLVVGDQAPASEASISPEVSVALSELAPDAYLVVAVGATPSAVRHALDDHLNG